MYPVKGISPVGIAETVVAVAAIYAVIQWALGVNRPGSFAQYLVIPAFNAFKIADEISDDLAAIFDPYGNAVHTALSFDLVGEDVLITGAGPIGIMAAAICKHVGARHVVGD